jgi:uncharacterized membrane protein HdeD (DUF308 family)
MHAAPSAMPFVRAPHGADFAEALRRGRRRLMVAGALALLLGIVAIVVPAVASVATAIFFGWILVVAAVYHVVDACSVDHRQRMVVRLLVAALTLAAGLYLLLAPLAGTFTLTVILVLWLVAVGVARLVIGVTEVGSPGAMLLAASGALELGLGLLIAERLPSSASWAIGLIIGIDLLVSGACLIALALALGRMRQLAA